MATLGHRENIISETTKKTLSLAKTKPRRNASLQIDGNFHLGIINRKITKGKNHKDLDNIYIQKVDQTY